MLCSLFDTLVLPLFLARALSLAFARSQNIHIAAPQHSHVGHTHSCRLCGTVQQLGSMVIGLDGKIVSVSSTIKLSRSDPQGASTHPPTHPPTHPCSTCSFGCSPHAPTHLPPLLYPVAHSPMHCTAYPHSDPSHCLRASRRESCQDTRLLRRRCFTCSRTSRMSWITATANLSAD